MANPNDNGKRGTVSPICPQPFDDKEVVAEVKMALTNESKGFCCSSARPAFYAELAFQGRGYNGQPGQRSAGGGAPAGNPDNRWAPSAYDEAGALDTCQPEHHRFFNDPFDHRKIVISGTKFRKSLIVLFIRKINYSKKSMQGYPKTIF